MFLTAVGATLAATARERNEGSTMALRATLIAAIPGMLLLALMRLSTRCFEVGVRAIRQDSIPGWQ
jgi:hypothetical protein